MTTTPPPELGDGVRVPPHLARAVELLIREGLGSLQRRNGTTPRAEGLDQFRARLRGSASGTVPANVVTGSVVPGGISAGEAAAVMGVSTSFVRRLARTGRIIAYRSGRDWLIDADSARTYRRGRDR